MNHSISNNPGNQERALQLLAQAFAAGLSEAARKGLQSTASVSWTRTERLSLSSLLQPVPASVGMEIGFDAGINGKALLIVSKSDLARIAGMLAGLECDENMAFSPQFMESNIQFIADGLESASRFLTQYSGLSVHASPPQLVNPEGNNAALLQLADSYSNVPCLSFQVKVEKLPNDHILLLVHRDLLTSLDAQLPHHPSAQSGVPAALPASYPSGSDTRSGTTPARWNLDLILDVELEVAVSFGETQMPLRDVLKLGVGSVIELDKGVNDPVTILVNDKPIVSGEVVVVNGNYGVKVLEVESTADRIRSMGR